MISELIEELVAKVRLALPISSWLAAFWFVLIYIISCVPQAEGPLLGAGFSGTIALTIFLVSRRQGKRDTTLEIFEEYYSSDFAALRRSAESFMAKYAEVDWSKVDPYEIGRGDENLAGYGAVLRYWQRVSLLFLEEEVDRGLVQRLLARELAHWYVLIFDPVFVRKNIFVRATINRLVHIVSNGSEREKFVAGMRDGKSMKRKNVAALKKVAEPGSAHHDLFR